MIRTTLTTLEQDFFAHQSRQYPTDRSLSRHSEAFLASLQTLGCIPCIFCHESNVTYRLLQTRSADEGMTTFYVCHGCHQTWQN